MKIPDGKKQTALWIGQHDPLDEAFYPKLMEAIAQEGPLRPGVTVVQVRHDENCPKLTGGPCRCDADVTTEPYTPEPRAR